MPNIDDLIENLRDRISSEQQGHTEFQIRNFIIGSQPTPWGRYRQCVLELRDRIKKRDGITKRIEELRMSLNPSASEKQEAEDLEVSLQVIERETYILSELFEETVKTIDLSRREELETDYWDKKFQREMMGYLITGVPIPIGLIQNIMALPDTCSAKKQISGFIESRLQQIEFKDQVHERIAANSDDGEDLRAG